MAAAHPYAEQLAAVSVQRRETTVLGGTCAYWVYGPEDAAQTMLFVHGFRGDHHGLEPLIAFLPPDVRVIAPDLPGFGESGVLPAREHDIEAFVAWLDAFAVQLGLDGRAVILGHSFGSIVVAATVAAGLSMPKVVLVNPIAAPALSGPRGILTQLAVFYYWASARLPERLGFAALRSGLIVRVMSRAMTKTKDKALRRWIHEEHRRYFSGFADRASLLAAFRASVTNDVSRYAEKIVPPALLIAAENDDITRVSAQHALQERMPDARLTVIPEVGHLIHYETPRQAAAAVSAFLAEDVASPQQAQPRAEKASESGASPA